MKKTYQPKSKEILREKQVLDASSQPVGRVATKAASFLMGKHKPTYATHMDMGDFVEVTNASKVVLTGNKLNQKTYKSHSGFPGGYKEVAASKLMKEKPERILEYAIKGMLPKNRLQAKRMKRLTVSA